MLARADLSYYGSRLQAPFLFCLGTCLPLR
jgi:hypothetical protein